MLLQRKKPQVTDGLYLSTRLTLPKFSSPMDRLHIRVLTHRKLRATRCSNNSRSAKATAKVTRKLVR
jgi:hypothetical protein